MTWVRRLPYCWRVSRYSPELRIPDSKWESWIDVSQVGQTFNGLLLTSEEYQRVEDAYVHAAFQFALDTSTQVFRIAYLGHQEEGYALSPDQTLLRSDLGPVVRGNLRGSLDCGLEGTEYGCQILFGFDLYMYVAASGPCPQAVTGTERGGLFVEPGVNPPQWEQE